MHRSTSIKEVQRVTNKRTVTHYRRAKASSPHCAICGNELNGISQKGGKTRRTNSRLFGGVLCAKCTAEVIKIESRVENGDMKLSDIGIKHRNYVLQLVAH